MSFYLLFFKSHYHENKIQHSLVQNTRRVIGNVHAQRSWEDPSGFLQGDKPSRPTGPRLRTLVSYWADLWCLEHSSTETKTSVKRLGLHEWAPSGQWTGGNLKHLPSKRSNTLSTFSMFIIVLCNRKFLPNSKGKLSSEVNLNRSTN